VACGKVSTCATPIGIKKLGKNRRWAKIFLITSKRIAPGGERKKIDPNCALGKHAALEDYEHHNLGQ
jgi:hypothetical protein